MEKTKTKKIKINFKIRKNSLIAAFLLSFLFAQVVSAATIYPSPSSGSYNVGNSFSVGVFVSSPDQSMNAVSGTLSFSKDKLEVTSVSKSNSVINLWVEDPTFSNTSGRVSFEGIVLNPGFTGAAGRVITVNFRTKAPGTADVTFSSGSVLANDGQGTSILDGLGSGRFSIDVPTEGPAAEESTTEVPTTGTLSGPNINSDTHPDSDSWYNISVPKFSWNLPAGTSATRLLVGSKPTVAPTVGYSPAISSRELDELDDGIWYFHVRLRNSAGWGDISHFRFQIDTQSPDFFDMTLLPEEDPTAPTRRFTFEAEDSMSGIGYYEIQIDDGNPLQWKDDGEHTYETPVLGPGKHTLIIKAVDKAGNSLTNSGQFVIDPLAAPII
ncbi:hypothetical protein HN859_05105, partial [Candidatus Parcubacteria bacterium]|nr:hypothetical protein [Candidatus Parcubacteria bacterium]